MTDLESDAPNSRGRKCGNWKMTNRCRLEFGELENAGLENDRQS